MVQKARKTVSDAKPRRQERFDCPVAERCGGCQLGKLSYPEQLKAKQKQVEELLVPFGPVEPILGMSQPFHYRNKVHAVLATDKRGTPISGVYEAGTHHVVPVRRCLIEDSRADEIIQTIVGMLPRFHQRIYNEYTHRGFLRHILVRTAQNTGQIMVVLVATALEFPGGRAFADALREACPDVTMLVLNENNRRTSMVLGTREKVLFGPGYLEDELCGCRFRISPQSFYQVNARQCEVLYRTAIDMMGLTGKETLLDAYCGTGTIGLCAAKNAGRLIGVELNAQAVKDAKENARRNDIRNATFLCDDAGRFMQRMAKEGHAPDVVCMDPPRAGSDEAFLSSLLTLAPKRVVYVSCNPETLARDLAYLVRGGYKVERAVPVDMFPNTVHVENVILLSKLSTAKHIDIHLDMSELDVTKAESEKTATYNDIKAYVKEHSSLNVSVLYIAQVKRKHGIIERECYNKPKTDDAKQPQCPPEKEKAIEEALRFFGMIA